MVTMCGVVVAFPNPLKQEADMVPCGAIAVAIVQEGDAPEGCTPARLPVCRRHRDKYLNGDPSLLTTLSITEVD